MQGLRGGALLLLSLLIFYKPVTAAEIISFPKKRGNKGLCRMYLSSSSTRTTPGLRSADIVQIDSYRSEYISPKDFFRLYSFGNEVFNPHQAPIMAFAPKSITDFNPIFSSANFSKWQELGPRFIISAQQESYILMGFTPRAEQLAYVKDAFAKGASTEYQKIMTSFAPTHHTTFVVPKLYRLILSTIEHVRSTSSYLLNQNSVQSEALEINFNIIFSRQDNVKYGARDFVSSWQTTNSIERQVQEFLIRFIDLNVKNNEEMMYEKEFLNTVLSELRNSFKNSDEVSNSLSNLENELMSILKLSKVDSF